MTPDDFAAAPAAAADRFAAACESRDIAAAMRACRQDAVWHAEGDVWTHTRMVLDELPGAPGWGGLPPADRAAVAAAALLHDAGKPATTATDPATGRLRSRGHARRGEALTRGLLRGWGWPLAERERVCALVRLHGAPPHLFAEADPVAAAKRLSWLSDTRLLHVLAVADLRGRRSAAGAGRGEDDLTLFADLCRETGCHGQRAAFPSATARRDCLRRTAAPGYAPPDRFPGTTTLVCGPPAAGKDTWLAARRPGLPVVSLDGLRAERGVDPGDDQGTIAQLARERCRERLRTGEDFALNATNVSGRVRARWVRLLDDYGFRIEIAYLEPPPATLRARNARRAEPVPAAALDRLIAQCEPPTWAEGHAVLFGENDTTDGA